MIPSIISGAPRPNGDEISTVGFFSRSTLPADMAENTRVRVIDAFEKRSFVSRVFVNAQSKTLYALHSRPNLRINRPRRHMP